MEAGEGTRKLACLLILTELLLTKEFTSQLKKYMGITEDSACPLVVHSSCLTMFLIHLRKTCSKNVVAHNLLGIFHQPYTPDSLPDLYI